MKNTKLTDQQQALLMLLVFILPALVVWSSNGMPTDKTSIGLLISAILSGTIVFIKEMLGGQPPTK